MTVPAEPRLAAAVFAVLAALHLLPVWLPAYLPTTDGPTHVYNAWILRVLASGEAPPAIAEHFEIHARPFPNWLGHVGLALLLEWVPSRIAEKLLATGYLLLFYGGAWRLASAVGLSERWWLLAVLPLGPNQLFHFGFFNFSLSLALLLWVLAEWWRHRAAPSPRFALGINLLLAACWFSHPLSFALAGACIGVLWLATLRERSWRASAAHVAALAPQLLGPLWFAGGRGGADWSPEWSVERTMRYFARLEALFTFHPAQILVGSALAACLLALLLGTLWARRRERARRGGDAFLLLAALATLLLLWGPSGWGGGFLIKERLSLYPWLLLVPGLATAWPLMWQRVGAAVLAAIALINLGLALPRAVERGGEVAAFVRAAERLPEGRRVLVLRWERRYPTDALSHAIGHAAISRGLVDWDDYEAKLDHFPVRFRASVPQPDLRDVARFSPNLRVKGNRDRIDAVLTWKMPADDRVRRALSRWYRSFEASPGAEVWVRRDLLPPAPEVEDDGRRRRRRGEGPAARPGPRRPGRDGALNAPAPPPAGGSAGERAPRSAGAPTPPSPSSGAGRR